METGQGHRQGYSSSVHPTGLYSPDGGYVRSQATGEPRNFGIVTGRIVSQSTRPYVFAWVCSEAGSMQERLSSVLRAKTLAGKAAFAKAPAASAPASLSRPTARFVLYVYRYTRKYTCPHVCNLIWTTPAL